MRLINIYFENHWQRTEVNSSFSKWFELLLGVPQRSLLGPLFNIYLNDLFYLTECNNVCNYADDTTFHACDLDFKDLITILEHDSLLAIEWFQANCIIIKRGKMPSFYIRTQAWIFVGKRRVIWVVESSKVVKFGKVKKKKTSGNCDRSESKFSSIYFVKLQKSWQNT